MESIPALPHAPIAEKCILSCMFREPSRIARAAAEGVGEDCFHLPGHKAIYRQLIASRDAGHVDENGEVDVATFIQGAALEGVIDRMGGPSAIAEISGYAVSASGWTAWGEQVREAKARRIALQAATTLSETHDSAEAIEAATTALEAMKRAVTARTRSVNAKTACEAFISNYVRTYEGGDIPGKSTGIAEIDEITGGMKPGELWVVGGGSSSGKSALMYQIESALIGEAQVVANFSAELMAREIVGRLVTLRAKVPYRVITTPKESTKVELQRINAAIKSMAATRMWVDDSAGQSLDTIASEAERIRDIEGEIGLIVVDYIQIIKGIRGKGDSREQEIASISGGLKQLAKKMECPVITGTQLNDDGKTRESRAIEQDSDVLMLIQEGGLLMKKVRNGGRGEVLPLALDGASQRFKRFFAES